MPPFESLTYFDAIARGIRDGAARAFDDIRRGERRDHPLIARWKWRQKDMAEQALWNNIYDNNPGELDRWADDGGR